MKKLLLLILLLLPLKLIAQSDTTIVILKEKKTKITFIIPTSANLALIDSLTKRSDARYMRLKDSSKYVTNERMCALLERIEHNVDTITLEEIREYFIIDDRKQKIKINNGTAETD